MVSFFSTEICNAVEVNETLQLGVQVNLREFLDKVKSIWRVRYYSQQERHMIHIKCEPSLKVKWGHMKQEK